MRHETKVAANDDRRISRPSKHLRRHGRECADVVSPQIAISQCYVSPFTANSGNYDMPARSVQLDLELSGVTHREVENGYLRSQKDSKVSHSGEKKLEVLHYASS